MKKDHLAETLESFESGLSCSQAVVGAFSEDYGLSRDIAFKISCPFGGGYGGYGRTCGALTGAMMVIGLSYGSTKAKDIDAKNLTRKKTRKLIDIFEKQYGTCNCNTLIGIDRKPLQGEELMKKRPDSKIECSKFLETVILFLEEELCHESD